MVSRRGARLAAGVHPVVEAYARVRATLGRPDRDPAGHLDLGRTENRLVQDLRVPGPGDRGALTDVMLREESWYGAAPLREAIARFVTKVRMHPVDPDDLVVVSGVTAALDLLAYALCDSGEAMVAPAPCRRAFRAGLAGRSEVRLVAVALSAADGYQLSAADLERGLTTARRDGIAVRALALSSPSRPVGHVYAASTLREILEVAAAHQVDVVVDETNAEAVFGPTPFVGVHGLPESALPHEMTHAVWGFAEDFGLLGVDVGVVHTVEPTLRSIARQLAHTAPLSTDTQALLYWVLADEGRATGFLRQSRHRLAASHAHLAALLDGRRIGRVSAAAGFSVWTDLRPWLPEATFAGEEALARHVSEVARVRILGGNLFGCPEPGWFRLCHAIDPQVVTEAIHRLGGLLATGRPVRVRADE
jgi:aspartate/methionine/tyrosine aminotransferase